MNISAKSIYDASAMRDLTYVSYFKKTKPAIVLLVYAILFLVTISAHLIMFYFYDFHDLAYVTVINFALLAIELDRFLLAPKRNYRALKKMKDSEHLYTFMSENFTMNTANEGYKGQCTVDYSYLTAVYETKRYIFLLQGKVSYVVDKESLDEKSLEALRGRLMPYFENKYKVCKY